MNLILPNQIKMVQKKENYRSISLMNTDSKILKNILAKKIQQYIKNNYTPRPSRTYSRDARLVHYSKVNVIHHVNRLKKKNHMIYQSMQKRHSIKFSTHS